MGNNKLYVYFSVTGYIPEKDKQDCIGGKTWLHALFEVDKNGNTSLLYEDRSNGQMVNLSPYMDKIFLISGGSGGGGSCWSGYYLEVFDTNKKSVIYSNKDLVYDKNSLYEYTFDFVYDNSKIKWLNNQTLEYNQAKIESQKCSNSWKESDKINELKTVKIN